MLKVEENLFEWAKSQIPDLGDITLLREQASSRKYYRVSSGDKTFVLAVSDPQTEKNDEFIKYSDFLLRNNISVPKVEAFDIKNGFIIMEDFGDRIFQLEINKGNQRELYLLAIDQIVKLQSADKNEDVEELNGIVVKEQMKLFEEWFLSNYLKLEVKEEDQNIINNAYLAISRNFLGQKRTLCHFDFELRNLMLKKNGTIGVLDFQDLTYGPLTLDLVSLIKDIENPISEKELEFYLNTYLSLANKSGLDLNDDIVLLREDLDYAGLQRQLRILGTLSRLHIRDGKSFRLPDLKQTLLYAIDASSKYEELRDFSDFLKSRVQPTLMDNLMELK